MFESFNGQTSKIWSNEYVVGSGWGTAAAIEPAGTLDEKSPELAIDPDGNAIAIWTHFNATGLGTNRYVAGIGWGTAATIPAGSVIYPQIAIDPMGNAVAVWTETDRNIWASTYR